MGNLTSHVLEKLSAMAPDGKQDLSGPDGLSSLDIPRSKLEEIAREIGISRHELALGLWKDDSHEAKLLSCMFSEPSKITEEQADEIARRMDSRDICEYCCSRLLWKLPFAPRKALEWANSSDDKESCLGFTLIAALADKMPDEAGEFFGFFDNALFQARKGASRSDTNVRGAITSALGMIGRRGGDWLDAAIETADEIGAQPCEAARQVASQSLAELKNTRAAKKTEGAAR